MDKWIQWGIPIVLFLLALEIIPFDLMTGTFDNLLEAALGGWFLKDAL